MPERVSLPWWKFVRALAPAVLFWAALVTWLAYLLSERSDQGRETDEANLREWIDEARSYRKTLPEVVREYLYRLDSYDGDPNRAEVRSKAEEVGRAAQGAGRSDAHVPGPAATVSRKCFVSRSAS